MVGLAGINQVKQAKQVHGQCRLSEPRMPDRPGDAVHPLAFDPIVP